MRIKFLVILICSFFTNIASYAQPTLKLLEPQEISIDAYKNEQVHDPYLEPLDGSLDKGAKFNLNLNVIKYRDYKLYWDNTLHFDQSNLDQQIKHAGWWYFIGATILPTNKFGGGMDLFFEHHSRHVLEQTRSQHFPVYDRYGIRFIFLKK